MDLNWTAKDVQEDRTVVTTLDMHAAGEPLRIVTGGLPEPRGRTMIERRQWMLENFDLYRRLLMHEPRGHRDMYGCVVTPPVSRGADVGALFLHNAGYSTMCGHGVIALVTALLETGALESHSPETPVAIDTPAGLVRATAHVDADGTVRRVAFVNVPSFLYRRDLTVQAGALGGLTVDVAFGGVFYAVLPAEAVGLGVSPETVRPLTAAAAAIKRAVAEAEAIRHPLEDDLGFLYGVIFTDRPEDPAHHSRNLCVFADAEVDRSPTGTGVSARLAIHHARGEVEPGQWIAIESLLGRRSVFEGRIVETTEVGPHAAIVPEVAGRAFITGRHEFILHDDDSLGGGFLV